MLYSLELHKNHATILKLNLVRIASQTYSPPTDEERDGINKFAKNLEAVWSPSHLFFPIGTEDFFGAFAFAIISDFCATSKQTIYLTTQNCVKDRNDIFNLKNMARLKNYYLKSNKK